MLTLRIAFFTTLFVVLAACGSGLAESTDVGSEAPDPGPTAPTTTVLDHEIEDPPLPTAPPNVTAPDDSTTTTTTADGQEPEVVAEEVAVYFLVDSTSGIEGTDIGCELAAPVTRRVGSPKVLTGAIEALLDGPTEAEAEAGYSTVLTPDVGWGLASVTITDGTAYIDFTDDSEPFNNMSASCVHLALMAQLEMTATQFPTVDRAVFSVGGDVARFYHWLERDVPRPEAATEEVAVYFLVDSASGIEGTDIGCELAAPVTRRVGLPKVLTGAIEALLDGPTEAEAEAGYSSVFTGDIGWGLASVTITDGTAYVDFTDDSEPFNNMSASCVHLALMAQLEMTATQFPTVDRAVFSVGGDIATFYHWLERDVPEV